MILLARHGRTPWNAQHRIQGSGALAEGIALDHDGIEYSHRLADSIAKLVDTPHVYIYTSPATRALQTAALVAADLRNAGYDVPRLQIWEELVERNFGEFEGKTWAECDRNIRTERDIAPKGGESLVRVANRAIVVANKLRPLSSIQTHLVISHQVFLHELLTHWATDMIAERDWKLTWDRYAWVGNGGWSPDNKPNAMGIVEFSKDKKHVKA